MENKPLDMGTFAETKDSLPDPSPDYPEKGNLLDESVLEMRWRCLSLAADLDRLDRAEGHDTDPRLAKLREAIAVLLEATPNRAERVQMIFSDTTPLPPYRKQIRQ
jgi:hypothetical protein